MAFDLETTGVNTELDRIVSSCVALIPQDRGDGLGRQPKLFARIVNPGIEVPQGAIDVHGLTNEYLREHGAEPAKVIEEAVGLLRLAIQQGTPIVGTNVQYDLTLLDREAARHGIAPVIESPEQLRCCIDTYVIDKAADPYRKGKRRLEDMCRLWDIKLEGAHNSSVDCLASARLAFKMARGPIPRAPSTRSFDSPPIDIGAMKLDDLHDAQVGWKAKQSKSFASWLRGEAARKAHADPAESNRMLADADAIRGDWPYVPRPVAPPEPEPSLW